jgi:hypothetical protein
LAMLNIVGRRLLQVEHGLLLRYIILVEGYFIEDVSIK